MLRILILFFFYLSSSITYANCDFKTGELIGELQNPSSIKNITITVPKSADWQKNGLKIFKSRTRNIPTKLKRSFKAKFKIEYIFGSCEFWGVVKQNGDERDHILLSEEGTVRSLSAKLDQGNILNSVRFKLLIPATRGGLNEVFGVSVLNSLGFITPETFQVKVAINGMKSLMIFQETARKELLERNNRREGPLFEGDESIIWGNSRMKNDDVSLARLENKNWFLKGASSQAITLQAFNILQAAYMLRGNKSAEMGQYIDPNIFIPLESTSSLIFPKFHFVIQALAAEHGLVFHNRKFYYNVFEAMFEPIYYDGNVLNNIEPFHPSTINIPFESRIVRNAYEKLDVVSYGTLITNNQVKKESSKYFIERSSLPYVKAAELFEKYWTLFIARTKNLQQEIQEEHSAGETNNTKVTTAEFYEQMEIFLARASKNPSLEDLGVQLLKTSKETYLLELHDKKTVIITSKELAKILVKNRFRGKHFTLLNTNENGKIKKIVRHKFQDGEIIASADIKIFVDKENRSVLFEQHKSTDWVLIKNVLLEDWTIDFMGLSEGSKTNEQQRFNKFGMTGCLNFFKTSFNETNISVYSGECEDSLNIVNSNGNLTGIKIFNGFSDAIDIDFSNISIDDLMVTKAGNDCFDISGGRYEIIKATLRDCVDKGISAGESSHLTISELDLVSANIGISSKDYSKVDISKAEISSVSKCVEVKQKKQEFGGASLVVGYLKCSGMVEVDEHSVFKKGL